jgi:transposase
MDVVYSRVAGLDIHKKLIVACRIIPGTGAAVQREIRSFGTTTAAIEELGDWLAEGGVTQVAMEATGVYWKPIVRREALFDREGMKGPLLRTVAAVH